MSVLRALQCGLLVACLPMGMAWAQPREVRVGVYANEPKIFQDAAGQPRGIMVDLLQEIGRTEGWTLSYTACEWNDCLKALADGRIDLMPDVAYSTERDARFDFHQTPALYSWSQVYRSPDARVFSIRDLSGQRVALLQGSIQAEHFSRLVASFDVRPKLLPAATLNEAFAMVQDGQADAAITNHYFGNLHAHRYGLEETPIVFLPARLFFATAAGRNADLLQGIDRQLLAWRAQPNSAYLAIMKKWATPQPESMVPRNFWWGLGGVSALLVLALVLAYVLRRQVAVRTRHLQQANEDISVFKSVFDRANLAAWVARLDGQIVCVNAYCAEAHEQSVSEMVGQRFALLYAPQHQVEAADYWQVVKEGRRIEARELWHADASGREWPMLTSGMLLRDDAGRPMLLACTAIDVSERKKAEARIHQLAYYDALTGLPNRRLLVDYAQHALAHCKRRSTHGALMCLDLDHFKTINDSRGHEVGDEMIREVARRIAQQLRAGDSVARLGGDEFVVLIEELSENTNIAASQAEGVGQKILAALAHPYRIKDSVLHSTVSIGVTLLGPEAVSVESLIKQAELAMYESKASGRNCQRFFDRQMQTAVDARVTLQSDLRQTRHGEQFHIHIQPQMDQHGRVTGGEVLLRWLHPGRGMVPPNEFIPVAEESGLMHEIGQWVLAQACLELVDWAQDPALQTLSLAVNVSTQQFRHKDFVSLVLGVLRESGANPRRLKLEITESLLMLDVEEVVAKMQTLRLHGVGFSIDDFGTGYSSLSYLKRLPLEQLKIDAAFVRDLLSDPNDVAIVQTIIALARSLDLNVVAEGVETQAQREVLAQQGCSNYQGYLFSRPVPRDDFIAFVVRANQQSAALG